MKISPRVLVVVLLLPVVCEGQESRIRLEISTNRYSSRGYGSYGYSGFNRPYSYYRYYYRPWYGYSYEYALHRAKTRNQRLEKRKIVYGAKRIAKAESRYRTRERIRLETGYVPQGPTMYDRPEWLAEYERAMYERLNK